ncbi:MAG: glutamate racemase [bacterium]
MRNRPIGVFDSGIGGLTVFRELASALPYEDIVYLGDTARVPYGIRSASTVIRYSFQNAQFLIKQRIKVLVVACNTVSAVSIEKLRDRFSIPVIGVIDPGARAAARNSRGARIGVIGTEATIKSGAYQKILSGLIHDVEIFARPCPLFVPLVEEGWTKGRIAKAVVEEYLAPLRKQAVDTLVLGCTHYPLLKGMISRYMERGTVLIDSAVETAKETKTLIKENNLTRQQKNKGRKKFFVTDSPSRFREVGERFLGEPIDDITLVDII